MGKEVGIFRFVRAVAVAGAVLLVVGCTGGVSEPTPTPVVVASPSVVIASPSPSMSHEDQMLALIPEDAKGDGLLAAEAMAKFFITLHPGLFQGEDTGLWLFLCLEESLFCSSTVDTVESRRLLGERQVGGNITFPEQLPETIWDVDSPGKPAYVVVIAQQAQLEVVDESGAELRSREAYEMKIAVALRYVDGLWRISGVDVDEL